MAKRRTKRAAAREAKRNTQREPGGMGTYARRQRTPWHISHRRHVVPVYHCPFCRPI